MALRSLLALALACVSLSVSGRPQDVVVTLERLQPVAAASEQVQVEVTFTNVGTRTAYLTKWFVPDGELEEDLFLVSRNGEAVAYRGPHYKRAAPTMRDAVPLAPGQSVSRLADLSALYDMSESGGYSIRYGVASVHLFVGPSALPRAGTGVQKNGVAELPALASNEVAMYVEGRPNPVLEQSDTSLVTKAGTVSFTGRCSATQQSTILSALGAASNMANESLSYLNGTPSATQRYTTWFGAYSSAGWNEVKGHFVNIKDALDNKPITVDCGCKKSYYAYVYPTQPYKIYVCRAFWSAPLTGTDSKGGTIIHELSHFNIVAGTEDWAYGHTAAKQLALSDPAKARDNADSHEYFAENTPPLP